MIMWKWKFLWNFTRIKNFHTIVVFFFSSMRAFLAIPDVSTDQGRSASSLPASARWSPPWPPCGRRAAWRWGSQGRRGRPAKPSTPVSAAPLSTWEDQKISIAKFGFKKCLKEIFSFYVPCLLLSSLLKFIHEFLISLRIPEISHLDFLQKVSKSNTFKTNKWNATNKQWIRSPGDKTL